MNVNGNGGLCRNGAWLRKSRLKDSALAQLAGGYTEAVIRILKFWRDARSRGATRYFRVVSPRSSARRASRSIRRSSRISLWRYGIVRRVKPIRAPLVDIGANVAKSISIYLGVSNSLRADLPSASIIRQRIGRLVAPGIQLLFQSAARGALPLRFGR